MLISQQFDNKYICDQGHLMTQQQLYGITEKKSLSHTLECREHQQKNHNFFLSYKSGSDKLVVQTLYTTLSLRKLKGQDSAVSVFWDEKCLCFGQKVEMFAEFLIHSQVS